MTNSITKAASLVNTLSKMQKVGFAQSCRNVFYSRQHFPKILGGVMLSGSIGGYFIMDGVHNRRIEVNN
jgi:hypothetical protein